MKRKTKTTKPTSHANNYSTKVTQTTKPTKLTTTKPAKLTTTTPKAKTTTKTYTTESTPISLKQEMDLLIALSKFFRVRKFEERKSVDDIRNKAILTPDRCVCIIGKSEQMLSILTHFADEDNTKPVPKFSIKSPVKRNTEMEMYVSIYSVDFLSKALNCFKCVDNKISGTYSVNSIIVKMLSDYPITLEGTHFTIIIAPRVQTD
jgi:hypothetical protein